MLAHQQVLAKGLLVVSAMQVPDHYRQRSLSVHCVIKAVDCSSQCLDDDAEMSGTCAARRGKQLVNDRWPGRCRFWFLIDFKDRLVEMLIDLEQTSEKLDRHARQPLWLSSYPCTAP